MVQRMIPQADWRREDCGDAPPIQGDRIEELRPRVQRSAVIFIAVRSQGTDLVYNHDPRGYDVPLEEPTERNPTCYPGREGNPTNQCRSSFL
jgi:hypothetical protein